MRTALSAILVALLLCLVSSDLSAQSPYAPSAKHAVVKIYSHGCSATVIWTTAGKSWLLGCAHAYPGPRDGRHGLDIPMPATWTAGGDRRSRVLHLDRSLDLSLVEIDWGPAPYVCPVAPAGYKHGPNVLSVGYDEMKAPPQMRPAQVLSVGTTWTSTRERPWHGRSGGALLDADTGLLIGVCSGYTGPSNRVEVWPGAQGRYVSHPAILRFLQGQPAPRQALPVRPGCPT